MAYARTREEATSACGPTWEDPGGGASGAYATTRGNPPGRIFGSFCPCFSAAAIPFFSRPGQRRTGHLRFPPRLGKMRPVASRREIDAASGPRPCPSPPHAGFRGRGRDVAPSRSSSKTPSRLRAACSASAARESARGVGGRGVATPAVTAKSAPTWLAGFAATLRGESLHGVLPRQDRHTVRARRPSLSKSRHGAFG